MCFFLKVTFDVDANGILNVSAIEKSTNKENKITITNDKGRLSREEIERMVNEAEIYRSEDDKQKDRISAKNNLESYCFNMKSTVEDEKIVEKISESDRKLISNKCTEIIKWMDANILAEKEEFEAKLKEAEQVCGRKFQYLNSSIFIAQKFSSIYLIPIFFSLSVFLIKQFRFAVQLSRNCIKEVEPYPLDFLVQLHRLVVVGLPAIPQWRRLTSR